MTKTDKRIAELLTEIDMLKTKLKEADKRISKLEKQNAANAKQMAAKNRAEHFEPELEVFDGCDCYGSLGD